MIRRLRESWTFLRRAAPGERFSRYHDRRQRGRSGAWQRPLWLIAGLVVVAVGIVLMPAPGPGMLIVAVGLALIAGESAGFAHWLDRGELRARRWLARWRHR